MRLKETQSQPVVWLLLFGILWNGFVGLFYYQGLQMLLGLNSGGLLLLLVLTPFLGVGIGGMLVPLISIVWGQGSKHSDFTPQALSANGIDVSGSSIAFWGGAAHLAVGLWLMATSLAPLLTDWWGTRHWEPTPCQVLSCVLEEGVRPGNAFCYSVQARYTYRYRGLSYTSDRGTIGAGPLSSPDVAARLRMLQNPHARPFCFVNPRHPEEAVLTRSIQGADLLYGGFGALLVCVGVLVAGVGSRKWINSNRPDSNRLDKPQRILFWLLLLAGWSGFGAALIAGDLSQRNRESADLLEQPAAAAPDAGMVLFFGSVALAMLLGLLYRVARAGDKTFVVSGRDFERMYERTRNREAHPPRKDSLP